MSENVKALRGALIPTNEPNEHLIETIKAMLADAESGNLQCLFATGFRTDGLTMACIVNTHPSAYEVIGAIELLKLNYINNYTESL